MFKRKTKILKEQIKILNERLIEKENKNQELETFKENMIKRYGSKNVINHQTAIDLIKAHIEIMKISMELLNKSISYTTYFSYDWMLNLIRQYFTLIGQDYHYISAYQPDRDEIELYLKERQAYEIALKDIGFELNTETIDRIFLFGYSVEERLEQIEEREKEAEEEKAKEIQRREKEVEEKESEEKTEE